MFAGIPAGAYRAAAELSGFRPLVRQRLSVSVAQTLSVALVMEVGGLEQAVTVPAAGAVNTATSELSFLVGEQAIATLPLNGRNYTDLALLQPGVLAYPSRDGGSVVAHGLGMSVNGQDYRSNVYLLDGTLLNDFTNGPAGSAAGTTLGIDAIREFRVESNAYSAEFGRNFGGQINVLTKSGTNTLRGSAYEFHRNDALDARNYFDVAGQARFHPQPVRRALGGPLRETACSTSSPTKGSASVSARRSRASCPTTTRGSASCRTARSRSTTRSGRTSTPSPRQRPVDRRRTRDAHLRVRSDARPRPSCRAALDYQPRRRTSSSPATPIDDAAQRLPTDYPAFPRSFISTNQFLTGGIPQRALRAARCRRRGSATAARASARTSRRTWRRRCRRLSPAASWSATSTSAACSASVRRARPNLRLAQNVYSGQYDLTHTRGRHLFKAGGVVEHYRDFMTNPTFSLGIYTFANVRAFLENRPPRFVGLPPEGDINRDWPWTLLGVYVQDHVALTRRLTVNAGLRYEATTMPVDTRGRVTPRWSTSPIRAPTVGRLYRRAEP